MNSDRLRIIQNKKRRLSVAQFLSTAPHYNSDLARHDNIEWTIFTNHSDYLNHLWLCMRLQNDRHTQIFSKFVAQNMVEEAATAFSVLNTLSARKQQCVESKPGNTTLPSDDENNNQLSEHAVFDTFLLKRDDTIWAATNDWKSSSSHCGTAFPRRWSTGFSLVEKSELQGPLMNCSPWRCVIWNIMEIGNVSQPCSEKNHEV